MIAATRGPKVERESTGMKNGRHSASVWVREADPPDGDREVQIGELGLRRIGGADRASIEHHLRSMVGETISGFHGSR
jgi:hypothetical protein